MKLALVTLAAAVTIAAAIEADEQSAMLVKICGDDLSAALQEACTKKSVTYLLEHGTIYDKQDHKHKHSDHHRRNIGHSGEGHGRDHTHHPSQSEQRDDESILEKCCHKPCLVKEFRAFCGDD